MRATAAQPAPSPAVSREEPRPSPSEAPPHAPVEGWGSRLLGPVRITGVLWFRLHRFGVRIVPEWALGTAIVLCTALFSLALRNIRRAVAANLEPVLGRCGRLERERRIFRTLHAYAWCLSERYERLSSAPPVAVEMEGGDRWRRALAESVETGQGLILVTGHIGSWEVGSSLAGEGRDQGGNENRSRPVHVVREEETDPRAQEFIAGLLAERMGAGYHTHFAAAADPSLSMTLLGALRRGEVVALQADRPRRGGKTLRLELFGRPYDFPAGPLVLARSSGVPLVPVFVYREGRLSYRVVVEEPVEVPQTADRAADLAAAGRRVAAAVEAAIRRRPHQWFCFGHAWPAG